MSNRPKILVACEYSGIVRDAFEQEGCNAWSCDLLPTERPNGKHLEGKVEDFLLLQWDAVIAHPPCTYLANSGVCHLETDITRWPKLFKAARFFRLFLEQTVRFIAIENPIMHGYGQQLIHQPYSQIVQPWMFGHMETKATCLWLKNLPLLSPTNNVKEAMEKLPESQRQRLHYLPPSKDRWKERSRTFEGLATAMAKQWTPVIKNV